MRAFSNACLLVTAIKADQESEQDSFRSYSANQEVHLHDTCFTFQAGVDYFERNMAMTVRQYVERFNHLPHTHRKRTV